MPLVVLVGLTPCLLTIVRNVCPVCNHTCLFGSLTDLEFIKVADAGLQRGVTKGDYCVLVEIMGHLLAVK